MNCSVRGETTKASSRLQRKSLASARGLPRPSLTSRRQFGGGQRTSTLTRVADIFVEESTDLTTFQNILLFLGGAGGIGLGVAVPYFYGETTTASEMRPNNTPCFVCDGTGVMPCRFCGGKGVTAMTLGSGEVVESTCVNCGGESSIVCTTCNGTGIQARYLDRREFADDD